MRCVRKQADEQADDNANGGPVVASDRSTAPGPSSKAGESKPAVIQEYLPPYLLNGHKFDFRLYVVVAGVNPLEAYLCRTGMVRRCVGVLSLQRPACECETTWEDGSHHNTTRARSVYV